MLKLPRWMRYGLCLPHHNHGLCLVLDLDWLNTTLTDSTRPWLTQHDLNWLGHNLDWLGTSPGHWALEAAVCSQFLAVVFSLALLSSSSPLTFFISPSMLQIKAYAYDRQAWGASNLFQQCCRRDSPFSSPLLPLLSILISERDQKTVSEAVSSPTWKGDRKRLQNPGSQREIMIGGWEGLPGISKVKAFFRWLCLRF